MKHTVLVWNTHSGEKLLLVCGSFIAGRPAAPGSQIRVQEKPIKDWPAPAGEEAKEADVVGG